VDALTFASAHERTEKHKDRTIMNIRTTSITLGVCATSALITASASASIRHSAPKGVPIQLPVSALGTASISEDVVTVTDSSGATVLTLANNAAALADAMSWVNDHSASGTYGVRAPSGRYNGFETVDNADLTWGNSPGVIDLYGGMRVRAAGQMLFEIAGTNNSAAPTAGAVQCDTVLADGNIVYEGRLSVALLSGFTPAFGNSFQLIATTTGKTVTWSGTLDAPTLAAGLSWQVSVAQSTMAGFGGESLYLTVVPTPGALALLGTAGIIGARRRRN
jgi:hypothetical protein